MNKGSYLTFFVTEKQRYQSKLLYDWLLEQAKAIGIHGGSAFRAAAGFGRHGVIHESRFFELSGELPMEVCFALIDDDADRLLEHLKSHELELFYTRWPVEFGVVGNNNGD